MTFAEQKRNHNKYTTAPISSKTTHINEIRLDRWDRRNVCLSAASRPLLFTCHKHTICISNFFVYPLEFYMRGQIYVECINSRNFHLIIWNQIYFGKIFARRLTFGALANHVAFLLHTTHIKIIKQMQKKLDFLIPKNYKLSVCHKKTIAARGERKDLCQTNKEAELRARFGID